MSEHGIFLFGASATGRMFLEQGKEAFSIRGVIDNDRTKWGKKISAFGKEITIGGIQELEAAEEGDVVLVASTWYLDIVQQLKEFGFNGKVYSFLCLRKVLGGSSSKDSIEKFERHFGAVEKLLAGMVSQNSFYLRHHGDTIMDTVLYATIKETISDD